MSQKSAIQWTDSTHNFWRGCTKVSPGCTNCYAEALVTTRLLGEWGKGAPRVRSRNFDAPIAWNKKPWVCDVCGGFSDRRHDHSCTGDPKDARHTDNVTWHRRRVFSLSLGDWLDGEVEIRWLIDMLDVILRCDQLIFILVTKRPELFPKRIRTVEQDSAYNAPVKTLARDWQCGMPPKNVWVLTSTENQEQLEKRGPDLLKIPAIVHGLSCEPLLGPININLAHGVNRNIGSWCNWVITGGESGPHARPCELDWIQSITDQCARAGVPCFNKQLGSNPMSLRGLYGKKGDAFDHWPLALRVRQFPIEV